MKTQEKERKKQPLISSFFKRIKLEENNYGGDDERDKYEPNIVKPKVLCTFTPSSVMKISSEKPHGNFLEIAMELGGTNSSTSAFSSVIPKPQVICYPSETSNICKEVATDKAFTSIVSTKKRDSNTKNLETTIQESVIEETDGFILISPTQVNSDVNRQLSFTESSMQTDTLHINV